MSLTPFTNRFEKIKKRLKKNIYILYFVNVYHFIKSKLLPRLISDKSAIKKYYYNHTKKKIDLSNPITFSQKQQWYKLNEKNALKKKCADKFEVRDYIIDCGYPMCQYRCRL